jgi:hypothetical protein
MKTPEQIIKEQCEWLDTDVIFISLLYDAMKEYAKQWVDETADKLNTTPRWEAMVDRLKQEIDAQ